MTKVVCPPYSGAQHSTQLDSMILGATLLLFRSENLAFIVKIFAGTGCGTGSANPFRQINGFGITVSGAIRELLSLEIVTNFSDNTFN